MDQNANEGCIDRRSKRMPILMARWVFVASLIGISLVGCSNPPASKPTPSLPGASPSLPPEIAEAIQFRTKVGIRDDRDFVVELAADRAAVARGESSGYGIPLTEAELIVLRSRTGDLREIAAAGHEYGLRHPDVFAGDYIDQVNGRYVFLVTEDPEGHRLDLLSVVPFGSPVVVELAETRLADLDSLFERVQKDEASLSGLGVQFIGLSVLEKDNLVELTVGAEDPAVEGLVLKHFGSPPNLRVRVVPGGVPLEGLGSVTVLVLDASGAPAFPRNVMCQLDHKDAAGWSPDEWERAPINSRCQYRRVPAGDVEARIIQDAGKRPVLARERGVVAAGEEVTITITMD